MYYESDSDDEEYRPDLSSSDESEEETEDEDDDSNDTDSDGAQPISNNINAPAEPILINIKTGYSSTLLSSLKDLQDTGDLCDISVTVGGRSFQAHKAVLAAGSGYFRSMFTADFQERYQGEVKIEGKSEIFEKLLTSAYSGTLTLSHDTVVEILTMAIYMQFTHTFELVNTYLSLPIQQKNLPLEIAVEISTMIRNAYQHPWLYEVKETCDAQLRNQWGEFSKMEGFLEDATVDFLEDVLDHGNFQCKEKELLECVVLWLQHKWEIRKIHAPTLLKKLRLGFIKPDALNVHFLDGKFKEIPECFSLYEEALKIAEISKKEKAKLDAACPFKTKRRNDAEAWYRRQLGVYRPLSERFPAMCAPRTTVTSLLSMGGKGNEKSGASYFVADSQSSQPGWTEFTKFSTKSIKKVQDLCSIVVNGRLYVAGYRETIDKRTSERKCFTSFWFFDTDRGVWHRLKDLEHDQRKFVMAYRKPYIYAIGGTCDIETRVQGYLIEDNEWRVQPGLLQKCHDVSVVATGRRLLVYGCPSKPERGSGRKTCTYITQVFDRWLRKWYYGGLTGKHNAFAAMKPTLVEHQGQYYRVVFQASSTGDDPDDGHASSSGVLVHKLVIEASDDDTPAVSLGTVEDQSGIPENDAGAFRVADDVFVNASGYIHKTGIKMSETKEGQQVDLGPWKLVNFDAKINTFQANRGNSVVCLTYDTKKIKPTWKY